MLKYIHSCSVNNGFIILLCKRHHFTFSMHSSTTFFLHSSILFTSTTCMYFLALLIFLNFLKSLLYGMKFSIFNFPFSASCLVLLIMLKNYIFLLFRVHCSQKGYLGFSDYWVLDHFLSIGGGGNNSPCI